MRNLLIPLSLLLVLMASAPAQKTSLSGAPDPAMSVDERWETNIPGLLEKSDVPGISIALVKNRKLIYENNFGVKNSETKELVKSDTVFEAASLSKPVVAYAVLQLVDAGKIDLDTPLNKYLGDDYDIRGDRRIDLITARHVLSHTAGFPNWRPRGAKNLPITFTPGEKFGYSGEGFVYLAKTVEKITGWELNEFIRKTVFVPLKMEASSFSWEKEFYQKKVFNHDAFGRPTNQNAEREVNAAASLHTTAADYARFVLAVLEGRGLREATRKAMLAPHTYVDREKAPGVAWGLGWGLELAGDGKHFFHWGDNGNNKSFILAGEKSGDAVVFFTNGANGLSFVSEIIQLAGFGPERPSVAWLDYERFDSPAARLQKAIVKQGAETALLEYRERKTKNPSAAISERHLNRLGYRLLRAKKIGAAIGVFRQNALDHPESANVWDSLAEGHMKNGDKKLAVKYYRMSLKLDPGNKNAVEMIKQMEKQSQLSSENER